MCRRFDTIPACDRQTDGRTDGRNCLASTALAMRALRRAVKIQSWLFRYEVHSGRLRWRNSGHHSAWDGVYARWSSRDLQGNRRTTWLCRSVCLSVSLLTLQWLRMFVFAVLWVLSIVWVLYVLTRSAMRWCYLSRYSFGIFLVRSS